MNKRNVSFKDKHENHYLYSFLNKRFYRISPTLHNIIVHGVNMAEQDLNRKKSNKIVKIFKSESIEELTHSIKKYKFFLSNNILTDNFCFDINKYPNINTEDIKRSIKNCKNVVLEVTQYCNLKCIYCINEEYYNNITKPSRLEYDVAKSFLDFILKEKITSSNIPKEDFSIGFYGGEPLLEIDLIKRIIKYLEQEYSAYFNFKYKITTNGVLLEQNIDFLMNNNFKTSISLDGDGNSNSFRIFKDGKESFDKVFSICKKIKSEYSQYFDSNISFASVLHKKNNVSSLEAFFINEFSKYSGITPLSIVGLRDGMENSFFDLIYRDIEDEEVNFEKTNLSLVSQSNFYKRLYGFIFDKRDSIKIKPKSKAFFKSCTCIPFSTEPLLKADGTIYRCTEIDNRPIGLVSPKSVELNYEDIIKEFNDYNTKLFPLCQKCYNFMNCDFCIYQANNKIDGKFKCDEFMNYQSFTNSLKSNIENQTSDVKLDHDLLDYIFLYDEFN